MRVQSTTGAQTYYMAGTWVTNERFGKRIVGYGNALRLLDSIRKETEFTYEIVPVD
jgi:hypothetical protein